MVWRRRAAACFASMALVAGLSVTQAPPVSGAGSWTAVAPMSIARAGLGSTAGLDGRIYALGGTDLTSYYRSAEVYSPSSNTWAPIAPMSTPRTVFASATGLDGRIYAIGGEHDGVYLNSVEAYTPSTNSWTPVASLTVARDYEAAATGSDGRIYAIGGRTWGNVDVSTAEVYDPNANTWTPIAPMSAVRVYLAAARGNDGRIYAIGGLDGSGNAQSSVEAYSPTNNSWAFVAPMDAPRYAIAAVTGTDNRIYALGGGPASLQSVEAYSPSSDSWSSVAPLSTGRYLNAAAAGADGAIYALGGLGVSNQALSSVEVLRAVDTTKPVLSVPADLTAVATMAGGAVVTYTVLATDPDDPISALAVSCNPPSGSTFQLGDTVVTCAATDPSGNAATGTFRITVVDLSPPLITIRSPLASAYGLHQLLSADFRCSDPDSAILYCLGTVASGALLDTSTVGQKFFSVEAADPSMNKAVQAVAYTIDFAVCALYDQTLPHNAGSTIALKTQLCDVNSSNASSQSTTVTATSIKALGSGLSANPISSGAANPGNAFRFDPTLGAGGGYIFNLDTSGLPSGPYILNFVASGDPLLHSLQFWIK